MAAGAGAAAASACCCCISKNAAIDDSCSGVRDAGEKGAGVVEEVKDAAVEGAFVVLAVVSAIFSDETSRTF